MNEFYSISMGAADQLMNNIDSVDSLALFYDYYKIDDIRDLEREIRTTVKDKRKFNKILKDMKMNRREFYIITNMIAPRLYNKRFVTLIKEKYNTK